MYLESSSRTKRGNGILFIEAFLSKLEGREIIFETNNPCEWMRKYSDPSVAIKSINSSISKESPPSGFTVVEETYDPDGQKKTPASLDDDDLVPIQNNATRKNTKVMVDGKRVSKPIHVRQCIMYLKKSAVEQHMALSNLNLVISKSSSIELSTLMIYTLYS